MLAPINDFGDSTLKDNRQDGSDSYTHTIIHRLMEHAAHNPMRVAFQEVDWHLNVVKTITYGELWQRTVAGANFLSAIVKRGDRVLIFFEPGIEPLVSFLACLAVGIIAVPAALPPGVSAAVERRKPGAARRLEAVQNMVSDCEPALIVVPGSARVQIEEMVGTLSRAMPVLDMAEFTLAVATSAYVGTLPRLPIPEEVAFLQYTSGSTALPKGVVITHANLVHNQLGLTSFAQADAESIFLSWLPMFHDMGLVGDTMNAIWTGGRCIKLTPTDFLRRPHLWMEAASKFRATVTGGPNFAFKLAASSLSQAANSLDLSCLHTCYCGSEPIREQTLDAFISAYSAHGLHAGAIRPCYGLAEGTLVVTGLKGDDRFNTVLPPPDCVKEAFVATAQGRMVSCGSVACPDARVIITDPESGQPLQNGKAGEIRVYSHSVSPGYWSDLKSTEPPIFPHQCRELRTGDIGLLYDGELYVSGRLKNTLIVRGRKFIAEDVESLVEHGLSGLNRVRAAIFAIPSAERENVIVLVEGQADSMKMAAGGLHDQVTEILSSLCGFAPDHVTLVRPSSLPRTTSGKLQRQFCAELWRHTLMNNG